MTKLLCLTALLAACGSSRQGGPGGGGGGGGGGDAGPGAADGSEVSSTACFDAWASPVARVDATTRPADSAGMRVDLSYGVTDGVASITLDAIAGETIVVPSDGPFTTTANSGAWAELRDDQERVIYTRTAHQLVPESVEVPGGGGGDFSNHWSCPTDGGLRLSNLANPPGATHLVLFQEPVDGASTGATIELARFRMP